MEWGTIVAADQKIEWLLPWWWGCYSKHQQQTVAFVDLGMSAEAQKWCKEHGIWIPFSGPAHFVQSQKNIHLLYQKRWEKIYGPRVWESRTSWFKKPFAMLQSPFQKSVWMDLDCEVCQSIDLILEGVDTGSLAAVKVDSKGHYNSGVIAYHKEAPLLKAWAEACLKKNGTVIGDETLLTQLIRQNRYLFKELPKVYNWMMGWGYHPDLKIAHWAASWGKLCIETMGGIQGYTEQLYRLSKITSHFS